MAANERLRSAMTAARIGIEGVSSFDQKWKSFQSPMIMPAPETMLHRGFRRAFEVAWEDAEPWSKPS